MTSPSSNPAPTTATAATAAWRSIQRPSAWTAATVGSPADYSLTLSPAMVDQLQRLPDALARRDHAIDLATLAPLVDAAERELLTGRAFVILKGFPTHALDPATVTAFCQWLGHRVGRLLPQNQDGDLIYAVEDRHRRDGAALFTSKTNLAITWHTDASYRSEIPDYVGLLTMRRAHTGGATQLISAHTIYNTLLAEHPQHLHRLFGAFPYSYQAPTPIPSALPYVQIPIFSWSDDLVTVRYNRQRLERGYELAAQDPPDDAVDAIDAIEDLFERDDLRLGLDLEPGDLYLIHNRLTIHARTAFTDPDPTAGRLLYRLWLDRHTSPAVH